MALVTAAFNKSPFFQAENLKAIIAVSQYNPSSIIDYDNQENTKSVQYNDGKIELVDADSIVLYLASITQNTNHFSSKHERVFELLSELAVLLPNFEKLDRASFKVANLPVFEEVILTDPWQILLFASLYPFHSAKFAFLKQYKWFTKFFKSPQINSCIKSLKNLCSVIITLENKKIQAAKNSEKKKQEGGDAASANVREYKATRTGERKFLPQDHEAFLDTVKSGEPILPKADKKNILITSALPYVNNVPHLGNIIGSVLSADVYARYMKHKPNYNVLFVGGTDEYGTATETKALEEKTTPRALCDKYHAIHRKIYEWFDIDFDYFGRTTTPLQTEIAQHIFMKLYENNYLTEKTIEQLYCSEHKGFLSDRYVNGTCPKCGYEKARGDQCDGCGALLDPLELIDPKCKLDNSTPVKRETDHMYLQLDKLQPAAEEWIKKASVEGNWTKNANKITSDWLNEGLRAFSITRDLKWGTPVPLEKLKDKVLYVWFDATIGYVSITANYLKNMNCENDAWKKWWMRSPEIEDLKLHQFMGKDNVSFHTIIFPSSLIGTGENWVKLHHIDTTEYLQYEGGKFSKSEKIGVFGDQAKDTGVDSAAWRFYLIYMRPESSDSQFSWDDFVRVNNTELLAKIANFSSRIMSFAYKNYHGVIPCNTVPLENEGSLINDLNKLLDSYNEAMMASKQRRGLELAVQISSRGNQFLQDNKLDNSLFRNSPQQCDRVVYLALNLLALVSLVISPFVPSLADKINKQLNIGDNVDLAIPDKFELLLDGGHNVNEPEHLIQRIDEKMVDIWRSKYGGKQA